MRRARSIAVYLLIALPFAPARAEPAAAATEELGEVPSWQKPAAAAAEAAAASVAAKAAAEARAAASAAAEQAKAAAAEAKVAASGTPTPETPPAAAAAESSVAPSAAQVVPAAATAAPGEGPDDPPAAPVGKKGEKDPGKPAKVLFGAKKSPAALAARSIGFYAKGCLAGARALAIDGPAWQVMRLSRNRNWGHPKLIALLERFAGEMQTKDKWPGLLVGDIAQPRGGPMLTGHKSHQVGLDADIWFRPLPAERMTPAARETAEPLLLAKDNGTEVIAENWNEGFVRLVKRAANYSEVERIFVHPAIKKAFCAAAGTDRDWLKKVRPMWLHNYHFHVRMSCPGDSAGCVAQKPITQEEGCGKELDDWIKLVSKPSKPEPKPVEPVRPSKPHQLFMRDLPPDCAGVLAAADPAPKLAAPPVAVTAPPKPNTKAAQH